MVFVVFGDLSKCRFWQDLCDYSILSGVHGMQEVVGSNPIGSINISHFTNIRNNSNLPLYVGPVFGGRSPDISNCQNNHVHHGESFGIIK